MCGLMVELREGTSEQAPDARFRGAGQATEPVSLAWHGVPRGSRRPNMKRTARKKGGDQRGQKTARSLSVRRVVELLVRVCEPD